MKRKNIWKVLGVVLIASMLFAGTSVNSPAKTGDSPTCGEGLVMEGTPVLETHLESRYGFGTWGGWVWRDWQEVDSCQAGWKQEGWSLRYYECRTVEDGSCYVDCDETLPRVKENKIGWHDNGAPSDYGDWVEQPDGSFARNYLQPQTKSWDWITYDAVLEGGICLTDPQVRNRNAQELEYDKACSEGNVTVQDKVYSDPQNNGAPVWQDWVNPLNGTSHRYGVQYFNSAWTQTSVDTRDGETVCAFEKGVDEGELELYEEKCSSRWTGRYMQTYQRTVRGHWVTWCNYRVPMEADLNGNGKVDAIEARKWEWSAGYLAGACALDCETQDWQGKLVDTFKEFKDTCGDVHVIGTLFGGNHFDNSCEVFDFCGWQESLLEQ